MDQTVSPKKRALQIFPTILLIIFLIELIAMGAMRLIFHIKLDLFIYLYLLMPAVGLFFITFHATGRSTARAMNQAACTCAIILSCDNKL